MVENRQPAGEPRQTAFQAVADALEGWPPSIYKKELMRKFRLSDARMVRKKLITDDVLVECGLSPEEYRLIRGGFSVELTACLHRVLTRKLIR